MISFDEAYKKVLALPAEFGNELVSLNEATGRVLAEVVYADRDYPPFDRSTKDGIAIKFEAYEQGLEQFNVLETLAAGSPKAELIDPESCMEIMTGAVIPEGADTVVMYEDLIIEEGIARIDKQPVKGQNIHRQGSDEKQGSEVLSAGKLVNSAEVGVLATVGKTELLVKKLPKVMVLSTGNELVDIGELPLEHQIRKSNSHTLKASLQQEGIVPELAHLPDEPDAIRFKIKDALLKNNVLLLSGGVSKGKFDYIPETMSELGVEKIFHGVWQRPGKPFWFGIHRSFETWIFSFPGNPVSTFVNYHVYFKNWLKASLGLPIPQLNVFLLDGIPADKKLTRFLRVKTSLQQGRLTAKLVTGNGSGDLISLCDSDGFIRLDPTEQAYSTDELVPFVPSRPIV